MAVLVAESYVKLLKINLKLNSDKISNTLGHCLSTLKCMIKNVFWKGGTSLPIEVEGAY